MNKFLNSFFLKYSFRAGITMILLLAVFYHFQKESLHRSHESVVSSVHFQKKLNRLELILESGSLPSLETNLVEIEALAQNEPEQLQKVRQFRELLSQQGLAPTSRPSLLAIIEEMRSTEAGLLSDREARAERYSRLMDLPALAGTLIACLLLFLWRQKSHRNLLEMEEKDRALQSYSENLKSSYDNLETQNKVVKLIMDSMADGVIYANDKNQYTHINSKVAALFGFTDDEVRDPEMQKLLVPRDPETKAVIPQDLYPIARSLRGESVVDYEMLIERPGVLSRIVSCNSQPVYASDGKLLGAVAVVRDVTARKQIETELRNARTAAVEAVQLKSRFLANMSHEIRTPMNGILGMAELLSETSLDNKQKSYVDLVRESCQSLLTIINDILDFSKIEAGKLVIEKSDFNLNSTIDRSLQLMMPKAREKGLQLLSFVSPQIPARVIGDSGRISQILVNLISNALKFTDRGTVVVRADLVGIVGNSTQVRISVEDSGVGLSSESMEKLFQPFSQADSSTSRKFGGTGLGLSICKELVDLMKGQIGVHGEVGKGSTFWFSISLNNSSKTVAHQTLLVPSNKKLLIYDFQPQTQRILKDYLDSWKVPYSRIESLARHQEIRDLLSPAVECHLLLGCSDRDVPVVDDFLETIQSLKLNLRVTLVTHFDNPSVTERFKQLGVDSVLVHPLQQDIFFDHLNTILGDPLSREVIQPVIVEKPLGRSIKSARILLAEDNNVNQLIAQTFLKDLGHSVQTVSNGLDVCAALKDGKFDLVLMDCQMPEMDGFEATVKIRNEMKMDIPIIALTANAMKGDEVKCREAGMNGYIGKPFGKAQLQAQLVKFLPKSQMTFDPSRLELFQGYEDDQGQDLRKALIESYLKTAPQSLADLSEYTFRNSEAFKRLAHSMKSSTASVGGTLLAEIFEELEMIDPKDAHLPEKLQAALEEFMKLKVCLEGYISGIDT